MQKRNLIFGRTLLISAVAALLVAGCSEPDLPPEQVVQERAQARWDALASGEFLAAWEFHSPGYRARNPAEVYAHEMRRRPVRWDSAEVLGVECQEDQCDVRVQVGYTAVGAPGNLAGFQSERPINESWIRLDEDWWVSVD